jgi:hypothetical protein
LVSISIQPSSRKRASIGFENGAPARDGIGSDAMPDAPVLIAGLEDVVVVAGPVEQGGGQLGIAEDAYPLGNVELGGDRGAFIEIRWKRAGLLPWKGRRPSSSSAGLRPNRWAA